MTISRASLHNVEQVRALGVGENPGTRKREDAAEHGVEELDEEAFCERIISRVGARD